MKNNRARGLLMDLSDDNGLLLSVAVTIALSVWAYSPHVFLSACAQEEKIIKLCEF